MGVLRFGEFTLDVSRRTLRQGDKELALRPQAFDVLTCLAEHAGRVLSKDDLIAAVWEARPASDDSLVQCITDIRQALGEDARSIIRTVPRRGYVLTAEVTALDTMPQPSPAAGGASLDTRAALNAQPRAGAPAPGGTVTADRLRLTQRAVAAAGLLLALLITGAWLTWHRTGPEPPVVLAMMALPTIAALPFEALDRAEAGAARALFDDITTEISRQVNAHMISLKPAFASRVPPW